MPTNVHVENEIQIIANANKCTCGKSLKNKPDWIAYDKCDQWRHGKCVNLTKKICDKFKEKTVLLSNLYCVKFRKR